MVELDWDDETHTINAEFIPDAGWGEWGEWGNGDRTHLTMSVTDTNKNSFDTKTLTVSVTDFCICVKVGKDNYSTLFCLCI